MELSDLASYAAEKYHLTEDHQWHDFPNLSVLTDPETGKWIALLMRQWDTDSGTELQFCDLKCGAEARTSVWSRDWAFPPLRMKGSAWIGIRMGRSTDSEAVFRLLDSAVRIGREQRFTLTLGMPKPQENTAYQSTAIPPRKEVSREIEISYEKEITVPEERPIRPGVPEKIQEMQRLYEYGLPGFQQKCRNFYLQGKFMEDYEDDQPYAGDFQQYFPCYHDLSVRQLRGYFTWRTRFRKGEALETPASFAYLYLYELLNGIGAEDPSDVLLKLSVFEQEYLGRGFGDPSMKKNLRRWMLEYAVVHDFPPEEIEKYAEKDQLSHDQAIQILQKPEEAEDSEVFFAISYFAGGSLPKSPVILNAPSKGFRLFAQAWRMLLSEGQKESRRHFTQFFGKLGSYPWHPLGNALVWMPEKHAECIIELNECRIYRCKNGNWTEERYDPLSFDKKRFQGFFHEADRAFRKYLKTGSYLREKPEEAWAVPIIQAVIEADRKETERLSRPEITIDFSGLSRIRADAETTRDSLLTEEEMRAEERETAAVSEEMRTPEEFGEASVPEFSETLRTEDSELLPAFSLIPEGVDSGDLQVLRMLLRGEDPSEVLRDRHRMPSLLADSLNEAFFDRIGDNILEYDGESLFIIEDYREDLLGILGGSA